ncbi:MAG: urate hydroxylase PuuD [Acidobacteriia bacterium]|jgi:uncharacterized membrane protein|nr:urate hydroxylase PuuD [Terriglobia bacterium]
MPVADAFAYLLLSQVRFYFPADATSHEQIVLRWIHFVAGITWLGLLYYFNFVSMPVMKGLESDFRNRVFAAFMPRLMWFFRWAGVVTVLAGLRYYMITLKLSATNAGEPSLLWRWLGWWFLLWLLAYAIIHFLLQPAEGALNNGWVLALLIGFIVVATSWLVLSLLAHPMASNAMLSIGVGGGLGLIMLLNVWGIIWRAQKRLIQWTDAAVREGKLMPPEAPRLARRVYLASKVNFWLSFPMLFFMGAADHYPFLSSIFD